MSALFLESAIRLPKRLKLGSLLASIAREAGGLSDAEAGCFDQFRDDTTVEPMRFEYPWTVSP